MDRGPDGRAKVRGAEGEEPEPVVVRERDPLFNVVDSGHQPLVNLRQKQIISITVEVETEYVMG